VLNKTVMTERQYTGYAILMDKMGRQGTSWKQYNEKTKDKNANETKRYFLESF